MPQDPVLLLVEGHSDDEIVRNLCEAAGYPTDRLHIVCMGAKRTIGALVKDIPAEQASRYAVLIDLDEVGVADALARARQQLGHPAVEVFCAVPTIEAWLFADERLALEHATSDDARRILEHLPLPEAIPNPKQLAHELLGPPERWGFLRNINVEYAAARSPSLRVFLVGIGRLLQVERESIVDSVGRTINRDVIASLISEILPSDTVAWRTTSGDYTAAEIRQHIESGTEIGRRYAMELLRVSRDLLMRKAAAKVAT